MDSKTAIRIALDVMGGDHGPDVILAGADIALERHPDIQFSLFGREADVRPILERFPRVAERSTFRHCDVAIRMDDKPSQALRQGRNKSSMWLAIEAVKTGEAQVAVSAGNTGALMAMAKFCLRTMANIERPAIAAIWPTIRGESIVLDVGATIGADAQQLLDLSVMGAAMARALFHIERPTVGLLNIGVEEIKGQDEIREAGRLLKEGEIPNLDYRGFVEGTDLGKGTVDVVVTEGFTGNIALKTAEGTARQIASYLRAAMTRTWLARLGYILAKSAFDRLRDKMDPRKVNGGVFLGLNGVVIKSHGSSDAEGTAAAIDVAYAMAANGLLTKIETDLSEVYARMAVSSANVPPQAQDEAVS
ncbi:phosphate acyltransferase PlsX [Aureimonas jatrophae]|uniref:Phosphate acyltransferase n=1 Tax=Aureimonas jatrophae TaxID=1166073 RepID=A0A1H0GTL9_9HYPH|nr:phosphate acyltransferase PlsX [Aureimonas jatrophae]MBB3949772.1 glycerol-3-phosphate acyltransferase PlsX [Aureimonas jatrophae]SDO10174.1 phosphate:acyl-[acyl carrier protein] acyltransferase [Aureimonas jatrophae]